MLAGDIGMQGYVVGLEVRPPAMPPIEMETANGHIAIPAGEKWDASVMRVNTSHEAILGNIKSSIRRQLPVLYPHQDNPQHIAIVGGGWSLEDTYEELRQLYFDGVKIIALNGSAKWLMERNLRPAMHVMLDARPENVDFVRDSIPHCKHFFASQCAPAVFDITEGRDVYLFHAIAEESKEEIDVLNEFYDSRWLRIPPAGTVGIVSILLMRYLGYRYQHLFGLDSCFSPRDQRQHAYSQPLNENDGSAIFKIAGREFECTPALASQAKNFMDVLQTNGEFLNLEVHGDGMLAHILKTGANKLDKMED